jgi:hypothetical protein
MSPVKSARGGDHKHATAASDPECGERNQTKIDATYEAVQMGLFKVRRMERFS